MDRLKVDNAIGRHARTHEMNEMFLLFLAEKYTSETRQTKPYVDMEDGSINILYLGFLAKAFYRYVLHNDMFFMEYVFNVKMGDDLVEVFRFYLSNGGRLTSSLEAQVGCDFNDYDAVRDYLYYSVADGILESTLLKIKQ